MASLMLWVRDESPTHSFLESFLNHVLSDPSIPAPPEFREYLTRLSPHAFELRCFTRKNPVKGGCDVEFVLTRRGEAAASAQPSSPDFQLATDSQTSLTSQSAPTSIMLLSDFILQEVRRALPEPQVNVDLSELSPSAETAGKVAPYRKLRLFYLLGIGLLLPAGETFGAAGRRGWSIALAFLWMAWLPIMGVAVSLDVPALMAGPAMLVLVLPFAEWGLAKLLIKEIRPSAMPSAVSRTLRPASVGRRVKAGFTGAGLTFGATFLVGLAIQPVPWIAGKIVIFSLLMLAILVGPHLFFGRPIGMVVCKLKLVREDGSPAGSVLSLVRTFLLYFMYFTLGLGLVPIRWGGEKILLNGRLVQNDLMQRQGWHDLLTCTYVVEGS